MSVRAVRRAVACGATIVAMVVAGSAPAGAITWGEPDGEAHPHVVALLFEQGKEVYFCSGTLLSPRVVLTAGHCTEFAGQKNTRTWASNAEDPMAGLRKGQTLEQFLNSSWTAASEVVPHPRYADFAEFPDTYDIGLVRLSEPLSAPSYGTIPALGFLDTQLGKPGAIQERRVTVVGFGMQGTLPATYQNDFVRYRGTSAITGFGHSGIQGSQTVQLTNNPGVGSGSGGTCFGDSGGPAFWNDPQTGTETSAVVAITSFGITGHCAGTDHSFRTDTAAAQDFLRSEGVLGTTPKKPARR